MGLMDRLRRIDERVGGPRKGESRRDYLARKAKSPWLSYENPRMYLEVVELHDRVTALETRLAAMEAKRVPAAKAKK